MGRKRKSPLAKTRKKPAPVTPVPTTSSQGMGLRIREWESTVKDKAKRLTPYHRWIEALALLLILGVG
ncbi:MAG: hypothetical protein KAV69_07455, partial [Deltaproteobacteria bacterium]|nr:hypothetical protein [Deltaproteobacteria bacterium]